MDLMKKMLTLLAVLQILKDSNSLMRDIIPMEILAAQTAKALREKAEFYALFDVVVVIN